MQYHIKKTNTICFDGNDLRRLFEVEGKGKLRNEIKKGKYSVSDLLTDKSKIFEIIDNVKLVKNKEDIEIFIALFSLLEFYPEAKLCFILKDGINPQKERINSLEKLKKSLKENDLTDFGLMIGNGLRNFQLKQYGQETNTIELFNFIKEKLKKYGNDLGEVNLLIVLQSKGNIEGPFFQTLSENLKNLNIKGGGHILVKYNEENKWNVINTVYPFLATTRIPLRLPSEQGNPNQ